MAVKWRIACEGRHISRACLTVVSMKSEKEIKDKIAILEKQNRITAKWVNSEEAKQDNMNGFREAGLRSYNLNVRQIKLLKWVLGEIAHD